MTDDTQTTEVKTMWSETLLESLYVAMEKNKGNAIVMEIIQDLKAKDYDNDYLVEKVQKKVGPAAATRLKGLLHGMGRSTVKSGRQKTVTKDASGVLHRIKGIFK